MGKDWLIRTKSKQLLGPVSKQKIIDCIRKGSLKADDEICRGNGYWFSIREKDLIDKYVFGPEIPPFNPISEAEDVVSKNSNLTGNKNTNATAVLSVDDLRGKLAAFDDTDESEFPDDDDLDFPEPATSAPKKASGKKKAADDSDDEIFPDEDDLAYPDLKKK